MRLSYSKIADYETCPRKFWFTYIKGLRPEANKYMIAGREIHEMLHYSTMRDNWKEYLLSHPKYDDYKAMVDNYIVYQDKVIKLGADPVPHKTEVKFHDAEYDFSLVIDRVDRFNGRTLITDYKSDAKPDKDKHDKQLLLYSYFYSRKFPEDTVTHYAPFFIKAHKNIKAKELKSEDVQEALEWLKKNKKEIEEKGTNHENFPPKPNRLCEWCGHRTGGYCKEGIKFIEDFYKQGEPVEFEGADISLGEDKNG